MGLSSAAAALLKIRLLPECRGTGRCAYELIIAINPEQRLRLLLLLPDHVI